MLCQRGHATGGKYHQAGSRPSTELADTMVAWGGGEDVEKGNKEAFFENKSARQEVGREFGEIRRAQGWGEKA